MEKKKRKRKSKRNILKWSLVAFGVGIFLGCCAITVFIISTVSLFEGEGNPNFFEGGCLTWWGGVDDPKAIETGADITLPPSATNLYANSYAWQDCMVFVTFQMDSDELEAFLASTHIADLQVVDMASNPLSNFDNTIQSYGYSLMEDHKYLYGLVGVQEIVVDISNKSTYAVYVLNVVM